jgi:hypothetical protein
LPLLSVPSSLIIRSSSSFCWVGSLPCTWTSDRQGLGAQHQISQSHSVSRSQLHSVLRCCLQLCVHMQDVNSGSGNFTRGSCLRHCCTKSSALLLQATLRDMLYWTQAAVKSCSKHSK